MKKILALMLALGLCLSIFAACDSKTTTDTAADNAAATGNETNTTEKKVLKIGTTATNEQVTEAIRDALAEKGYEMEIVMFQDPIQPNTALDAKEVDATFMEHEAYMQSFVDNNGYNLKFMEPPIIFGPFGCYSVKHKSIDDLPDGAQVTMCSDASNKDRSLIMLQSIGLITLADEPQYGEYYIAEDIIENPKNITFIEAEEPNVPTTLQDVDMIVAYNPTMYAGNYDVSGLLYLEEYTDDLSDLAQGVVINGDDANEAWVKDLMDAFTSDTAKTNLEKANDGSFIIVFDK